MPEPLATIGAVSCHGTEWTLVLCLQRKSMVLPPLFVVARVTASEIVPIRGFPFQPATALGRSDSRQHERSQNKRISQAIVTVFWGAISLASAWLLENVALPNQAP